MLWRFLRLAFDRAAPTTPLVRQALDLRDRGDLARAEQLLRAAIAQHPADAIAATNLAVILLEQDEVQEAVALLQRALELDTRCAAAHFNYANVLRASGRMAEAIEHYGAAKRADSSFNAAPEQLMQALLEVCDWDAARVAADELRDKVARTPHAEWMQSISPLTAIYLGLERELCKQVASYHAPKPRRPALPAAHANASRLRPVRSVAGTGSDRIRIAYLSRDFRDHPVGQLLRGALGLHDRTRFEVHAISYGLDDDSEYRKGIVAGVDCFHDIARLNDDDAACLIADARIDVLIDMMGHTTGNRLGILARRPAPVQVHYLGYAGTTGAPYIDYFISDEVATPPHLKTDFSEEVACVSDCFMVSEGSEALTAPPARRAAHKLPPDAYVFANFGNASRITQKNFQLWMRILEGVPGSILWLKGSQALLLQNLRGEATHCGIDASRLYFADRVADKSAHYARLALTDLALDTIGWHNGHSTSADMLWAGVPVLTAPGSTFASRVATSLVTAADLQQLIAKDADSYVATAIRLGNDRRESEALRTTLIAARSSAPFFDTARLVRGLEGAYAAMFAAKMRAPAGL